MHSKKQLKILNKMISAREKTNQSAYEYQEFVRNNPVTVNTTDKLKYYHRFYVDLANFIHAFINEQVSGVFQSCLSEWEETKNFLLQQVSIPDKLQRIYDFSGDLSLARVLYVARHVIEHTDKIDQEKYMLLADSINPNILMQALYKMDNVIMLEVQELSTDEVQILVAESPELRENIFELQETLKYIPVSALSDDQKKVIKEFENYIPDSNNVKIIDPSDTVKKKNQIEE